MNNAVRYYDPPLKMDGEDVFYTGRIIEGGAYPFRTTDGRWGMADAQDHVITPAIYEQIAPTPCYQEETPRFVFARRGGLWGMLNGRGQEVMPCAWDRILHTIYNLYAVQRDGLWGFMRLENDRFVPAADAQYAHFYASKTEDGVGVVFVKRLVPWGTMTVNGEHMTYALWGALDGQGQLLAQTKWPEPSISGSHGEESLNWSISSASVFYKGETISLVENDRLTQPFREGAYL